MFKVLNSNNYFIENYLQDVDIIELLKSMNHTLTENDRFTNTLLQRRKIKH